MSGPLGPEVKRTALKHGAMLYDSSRASNLTDSWFDLRYWESLGAIEGQARGRGLTRYIKADGQNLALRRYRRGGLVALFSGGRYLFGGENSCRPFREWRLTYRLHRAGLPVATPIAARYRRRFGTYTGEIITERLSIRGSVSECLRLGTLSVLTWIEIGRCIRRFHDFGLYHADLTAHNLLLGSQSEQSVYLIDFDRCRMRKAGLWRDGNLVRLRRSLEKVTYSLPRERFTEADWHALLDGYREAAETVPEVAATALPESFADLAPVSGAKPVAPVPEAEVTAAVDPGAKPAAAAAPAAAKPAALGAKPAAAVPVSGEKPAAVPASGAKPAAAAPPAEKPAAAPVSAKPVAAAPVPTEKPAAAPVPAKPAAAAPASGEKPAIAPVSGATPASAAPVSGAMPASAASVSGTKPAGPAPVSGTKPAGAAPVSGEKPAATPASAAKPATAPVSGAKPAAAAPMSGAKPTAAVSGAKPAAAASVSGAKPAAAASVPGAKPAAATPVPGATPAVGPPAPAAKPAGATTGEATATSPAAADQLTGTTP